MRSFVLVMFFIVLVFGKSEAQFRDSTKETIPEVDTTRFHMRKSPTLALVLSGILPGAGQIYTGRWYWAPVFLGGIAGCFIGAFIQNNRYQIYSDSVNRQTGRNDLITASRYITARDFYHDDRDKWYIYAALFYLANLIDAYISAHLYDFDVSEPSGSAYFEVPQSREEPWRFAIRLHF